MQGIAFYIVRAKLSGHVIYSSIKTKLFLDKYLFFEFKKVTFFSILASILFNARLDILYNKILK